MGRARTALRRSVGDSPAALAAGVAVAVFFGVFFAWPVAGVLTEGLRGSEGGAQSVLDLFGSASFRSVLWFTIWQASVSTALTVLIALPAAGAIARMSFRGRRVVRALVTVPFVLPTVVVAAAFEGTFDRFGLSDGSVQLRHTAWAILIAHVFFNYAVVVRTVGAHWAALDGRIEDQARVLGASRGRVFREITLPRLAPSISAAAAIVFLFSFTSYGVVLVLGGPARATIETEIYRYAIVRFDLNTAAALAVMQLTAVVALVLVSNTLERRRATTDRHVGPATSPRPGWGLFANLVLMTVVLGVPIFTLVERSFSTGTSSGYSFDNYTALGDRVSLLPDTALVALGNSLMFAVAATAIATAVGGAAALVVVHGRNAVGRVFDLGLTLPLGTSAVTVGLGLLLVLDRPPLDLRTSTLIVPIAHAVVGIPFVVRTLVPMLRAIDPHVREAAAVLGASPGAVRREIDLRVAARGLAVGGAFAFAVSLGEFGATSFIPRRPETLTAPLAIFRLLGTPGDTLRGQAMALAVVLMVLTAVVVFLIDLMGDVQEGAF